jgi:hypothetical protein
MADQQQQAAGGAASGQGGVDLPPRLQSAEARVLGDARPERGVRVLLRKQAVVRGIITAVRFAQHSGHRLRSLATEYASYCQE